MVQRIILGFKKFLFCYTISADLSSFIKLVSNTKKFKWNSKKQVLARPEDPVEYNFRINGRSQKVFLRTYAGDISIFYELFFYRIYKLPETVFVNANCIVDTGAHIGLASLYFLSQCPRAKIISIEPDAENFSILEKNLEAMIQSGKVKKIHAAVDSKEGFLRIKRSQFSYNTKVESSPDAVEVSAISFNSLIAQQNVGSIDILKIDVEGSEEKIFTNNIEWLDQAKNIILETHSEAAYSLCAKTLFGEGFQIRRLNDAEDIYWASR